MSNQASYYVFRINYGDNYTKIRNEIINHGRLRQGWGASQMELVSEKNFINGWIKRWGPDDGEDYMRRKYNNLRIMRDIKVGDYIIVPKLSLSNKKAWVCDSFLIARCKATYSFNVLDDKDDFGHIIELDMEKGFSCAYSHDENSILISSKFKAYQKALNRVRISEFENAVNKLVEDHEKGKNFEASVDIINIVQAATKESREVYLKAILERIRKLGPNDFEKLITSLFEKNGYTKIGGNWYDRKGGDVDIIFEPYAKGSLMNSLHQIADAPMPLIYVQAKKKSDIDYEAVEGVRELINMKDQGDIENPTLILINLTDKFVPDAQELANEHGVILIDGLKFAELLERYGIDI